jgi:hypothetical protein
MPEKTISTSSSESSDDCSNDGRCCTVVSPCPPAPVSPRSDSVQQLSGVRRCCTGWALGLMELQLTPWRVSSQPIPRLMLSDTV